MESRILDPKRGDIGKNSIGYRKSGRGSSLDSGALDMRKFTVPVLRIAE